MSWFKLQKARLFQQNSSKSACASLNLITKQFAPPAGASFAPQRTSAKTTPLGPKWWKSSSGRRRHCLQQWDRKLRGCVPAAHSWLLMHRQWRRTNDVIEAVGPPDASVIKATRVLISLHPRLTFEFVKEPKTKVERRFRPAACRRSTLADISAA